MLKNKVKKFLMVAGIVAVVFVGVAGCGASNISESTESSYEVSEGSTSYDGATWNSKTATVSEGDYSEDVGYEEINEETSAYAIEDSADAYVEPEVDSDAVEVIATQQQQKLVVTWDLSLQTKNYDETVEEIEKSVSACGGYIENQNENTYGETRYATFTIRLPEDEADEWLSKTEGEATVTSKSKSVTDVTLSYVDTESRLKALYTERDSLLEILAQADNVTDLITVQNELSNVNYEIESYESSLRALENQVNYTTIYLNVDEVDREVPTETTIGEDIKETFLSSMDSIKYVARNLIVGIIGNSVMIVIWIVIILLGIKLIPKIVKRILKK